MKHTSYIKNISSSKMFIFNEFETKYCNVSDSSCQFRIVDNNEYIGNTNINFMNDEIQKAKNFMSELQGDNSDFIVHGKTHQTTSIKFPTIEPEKLKDYIINYLKNNIENFFTIESLEIENNIITSIIENNHGLQYENKQDYWCIMLVFVVMDKKTNNKQNIYDFAYISNEFNIDIFLENIKKQSEKILNPKKLKQGTYDVLLDNGITQFLIKNIFSMMKGSSLYNKSSSIKLGDMVLPSYINILENPNGFFPVHVDCDGMELQQKYLIKNGKVNSFILNSKYATKLNLQPTGNCFNFSESVSNIEFENLKSYDLFIKNFTGLHVTEILGVNFNSVNGDFSCSIKGFEIKNGQKINSFIDGTMSFNLFDIVNKSDLLDDLCHSGSSFNCPSMLVYELNIGGI